MLTSLVGCVYIYTGLTMLTSLVCCVYIYTGLAMLTSVVCCVMLLCWMLCLRPLFFNYWANIDWDFRISDLIKNPDGTDT